MNDIDYNPVSPRPGSLRLSNDSGVLVAVDGDGNRVPMLATPGTPVGAVAASATLNPTGANNSITFTAAVAGMAGNQITVALAAGGDYATTVSLEGNAATVNFATKKVAEVTGTLTDDGETTLEFPTLSYKEQSNGFPYFREGEDELVTISNDGENWNMAFQADGREAFWTSTSTAETPDLVPSGAWNADTNPHGWKPTDPATGTPVVTLKAATAQMVIDAVNAAGGLIVAEASGTVTGNVAAVNATALTGGIDGTPALPGQQMIDSDYLYTATARLTVSSTSGWVKSAVDPL